MKYECRQCGNDDPCNFSWAGSKTVHPPPRCPYHQPTASWRVVKEPDPHVVTKEPRAEDIVKLADKLLYEHSLEGSRKALRPVFRLIAAKIEAVRNLFRNHEGRIKALENCVRILGRRTENQEARISQNAAGLQDLRLPIAKPQPKGGVALDKEGMPHDLIPGRSVVFHTLRKETACFIGRDEIIVADELGVVQWLSGDMVGRQQIVTIGRCTFLFNLPSPGGDK